MAGFIASIFAAGQTYFVCRMSGEIQSHCCCGEDRTEHRATISDAKMDCCETRMHAAPGTGVTPVHAPMVAAALPVSHGEPIALVEHTIVRSTPAPSWTGPPLDQRRALISVFLL